ncbi:aminoglycoside 6'-N-acetyltransferase [Devosia sp.]|uniref:aminoglycoside 6'-N-acetyltransferase n=1 Tax=Devosia sp. TaxID=1871048 RepID=UPI003BAC8A4A
MPQAAPRIAEAGPADRDDWLELRTLLWPGSPDDHPGEMEAIRVSDDLLCVIARGADERAVGFAEAAIRRDYVNGCDTSPVGFLEGIFVRPEARRLGVARALVAAAADWVRSKGCSEFASDAEIDNLDSHNMHSALGFVETQRVVYFRQRLIPTGH